MNHEQATAPRGTPFATALGVWLASGGLTLAAFAWLFVGGAGGDATICLFRIWTGIACPACGMTRAVSALLAGDLSAMIDLHPLAPLVLAEAGLAWIAWGVSLGVRRRGLDETRLAQLLVANAALFVIVWIVRLLRGTLPL